MPAQGIAELLVESSICLNYSMVAVNNGYADGETVEKLFLEP